MIARPSEDSTVLVCARVEGGKLMLPDNRTGPCCGCWSLVQYRPHAPPGALLYCMECVATFIDPEQDTIVVPEQMAADAREYFRRKKLQ